MIDFPDSPTNGQQFSSGGKTWTWDGVKWVNAACLPLTGGTLTGALNGTTATFSGLIQANGSRIVVNPGQQANVSGVKGATTRWVINLGDGSAESTGNAGSNFNVGRFDDAGNYLDNPLTITRATGQVKLNVPAGATVANFPHIDGPAGVSRCIMGSTSGSERWALVLGTNAAESGGNVGSNFQINRYDDTGAVIDVPFAINRASGFVSFGPSSAISICGASGTNRLLSGRTGASNLTQSSRWDVILGTSTPESSGNVGSDFAVNAYGNDGTTYLGTPFSIKRSTSVTTFSVAIVNGPSDRTLKENVEPITDALNKVNALQGVSFNMIATPDHREIGLIAQDVEPVVPEILQTFDHYAPESEGRSSTPKLALDYPKLTALLIEAVKELTARVAELEAAHG